MVKICSYDYPANRETEYAEYYKQYPYDLHDFQKWCVEATVTNNHLLVCCPTGSGKTFGGEFAINYLHSLGKKVIYTTPIKALSNEKYYAFTNKYPHIKIGLITGDIKTNPDADVLIMTTEILLNKLYQIQGTSALSSSFDMDIQNELGCVVFDEIHMINDESRGHVWEQTIMMLPSHIQIVGLSATLDNPERFASWIETKGEVNSSGQQQGKIVYLTRKLNRAVPLIHYSFITATNSVNKAIRDKTVQEEIKRLTNKPYVILDEKGVFNDLNYGNTIKTLKLFEKHEIQVKRQFVLNQVSEYLVQNEMLPALCYVFSRKNLEKCAEELTTNLLEFDSKIPYTVDHECEKIIRKLPNYEEYLHLPEYVNVVKLLRKGVGIHHAGMMPILREMIELLFARGFIKMLFCTETMSVGINLPVKTAIFTDVNKFNGDITRMLYSHEYTQAAGRAGRLGLDKVGHVIHLNNLFRNIDSVSYKNMMNGKPQSLISKFKISYNMLLNLIEIGSIDLKGFASRSMMTDDLNLKMGEAYGIMSKLQGELENINSCIQHLRTPFKVLDEFKELNENKHKYVNKKRKEVERRIQDILDNYKFVSQDSTTYSKITSKEKEINDMKTKYEYFNHFTESNVNKAIHILIEDGLIEHEEDNKYSLTPNGKVAAQIRELHGPTFAKLYTDHSSSQFHTLSSKQLVSLFSCFTCIRVPDELTSHSPKTNDVVVTSLLDQIKTSYAKYSDKEAAANLDTGAEYNIHYDLLEYVERWCNSENIEDCKIILQEMESNKQIFLGEFVKALLKISNIASEFEKIAEMIDDLVFLEKIREIPHLILKYIVTNQSLYV